MNKRLFNRGEDQQHFSLRKLTVGVASVLLGTTFMVFGSQSVQASEVNEASVEQVQNKAEVQDVKSDTNEVQTNTQSTSVNTTEAVADNAIASKSENDKNSVSDVTKQFAANLNSEDTVKSDANVNSEKQTVNKLDVQDNKDASTSDPSDAPVTRDDVIELFGLDKSDISAEDLAKLGLKSDEYYYKGVKYHVKGTAEITDLNNGEVYNFDNIKVLHNADGTFRNSNADVDDDLQVIYYVSSAIHYSLLPVVEGNTIYVNKGSQLTAKDAERGIDTDNPEVDIKNAVDFKWDNSDTDHIVDINTAGVYDGMIDVYYELGQGDGQATKMPISVGVKVVVVDLQGKDQNVHIGADVPTAETSVNGAPAGSKATWTVEPKTNEAGTSTGTITVTYPDGNTGTANVTLNVIAPQVKDQIEVWQGDPVPAAKTLVTNKDEIADKIAGNTTYTWGTTIDTSAPSDKPYPATIITHWADGKITVSDTKVIVKKVTETITDGEGTHKDVTRDIYTQIDGQEPQFNSTETATLHRTGTKNLKTGEITWNAWEASEMPAVEAPTIKDYHVTNPEAGAAVAIDGSQDKLANVVFHYSPDHSTITDGEGTEMTVTRDIYTQLEGHDATRVDTQEVTLHRTGDKNNVTGEITWGAWTIATIPAYKAPEIANYHVTNPNAGFAVRVDGSQAKLADVVFHYDANHETITDGEGTTMVVSRDIYTKLEGHDANKVDTQEVILHRTGDKNMATGEIKWNAWGIETMPSYTAPVITNYTVTNPNAGAAVRVDGSQAKLANVVFNYKANHETITDGEGTQKTVTRDIYTQLEGQDRQLVDTQTVILHRTGDKNLATGEITWGDWNTGTFSRVNAPVIAGYTVTNPNDGRAVVVTGSTKNSEVVFNYTANSQTQLINYVDEATNQVVKSETLHGKTDTSVDYIATAPEHYQFVEGQATNIKVDFGSETKAPINIYVTAKHAITNETHTVTRTVEAINPVTGENINLANQTATITRTVDRNEVTGQIAYGKWTSETLAKVNAPEFTGYTVANPDDAPELVVNNGDITSSTVIFRYNANAQQQLVNYVNINDTSDVVGTQKVDGKTNETVSFTPQVPTNWEIVAGQDIPAAITFNVTGNKPITIYVEHGRQSVKSETQSINRTVNYVDPVSGDTKEITVQTVTLERQGYKDLVTGDIIYGNWTTGSFAAVAAPAIAGYYVLNPGAAGADVVTAGMKDYTVTFNYAASYHNAVVNYVNKDDHSQIISSANVAGQTGSTVVYTPVAPANWQIVAGQDHDISIHFGTTDPAATIIYVEHKTVTVTDGTSATVSRNVYTQIEGQAPQFVETQSVTLHRTAEKDVITGQITYGEWNTDTIPAVSAPEITNYHVTNPDAGQAVTVNGSVLVLPDVVFNYAANHETIDTGDGTTMTVKRDIYTQLEGHDATKADTQEVTLHRTGDKNMATGEITWGAWSIGTMDAYKAPVFENYTVENPNAAPQVTITSSTKNMSVTFTYKANHETITDGEGTQKTVTRDIYTQLEGHDATKVDTQSVTLHRTGDKNLATGEIVWGEWSTGTMGAYTAPVYKNYTVTNPDAAPSIAVTGTTDNMSVTFTYKANHETITDGDGTHMTVTRDIYTQIAGQDAKKVDTQSVTLHRTGDKNLATGEIVWGEWSTGTMDAYKAPELAGYHVTNPDAAPQVAINSSTKNMSVTFNYNANDQKVNVNYVDEETHNVITSVSVDGKTGQTVDFNADSHVPSGWTIVKGQNIPTSFTFGETPLKDVTILIHHNENDRYKVALPDGEKVTTHVGANETVPSLNPSNVNLIWSEDGKTVSAPAGVKVEWANVPATDKITDETGTLKITFSDGTSTTVDVPVTVQGATAGDIVKVDQNDPAPAAKSTVNTSTVDHFGISDVTWANEPSTKTPGAAIPGTARVHYLDGTYQDVDVNIDVREVRKGEDHKDDKNIYRAVERKTTVSLPGRGYVYEITTVIGTRTETIDYAYPVGHPNRVTYTKWVTTKSTRYEDK